MIKEIGKIQRCRIGRGGYDEAMFGISWSLGSDENGWGCGDFWGWWSPFIKAQKDAAWTEEDRTKSYGEIFRRLADIMEAAKKKDAKDLIGVPIEATFDSPCGKLTSWRVLTEAI